LPFSNITVIGYFLVTISQIVAVSSDFDHATAHLRFGSSLRVIIASNLSGRAATDELIYQ
jgi:hypothetical protein